MSQLLMMMQWNYFLTVQMMHASTRDCGLSKNADSSTVTDGMRYHEPVHDIGANQQNFIDTTDAVEPASKRMATNMVSEKCLGI